MTPRGSPSPRGSPFSSFRTSGRPWTPVSRNAAVAALKTGAVSPRELGYRVKMSPNAASKHTNMLLEAANAAQQARVMKAYGKWAENLRKRRQLQTK